MADHIKFRDIFNGLTRAHGVYHKGEVKENGKVSGKAFILKEEVTDTHWKNHIEGIEPSLGIVPIRDDSTCSWCCIDVDDYTLDILKTITNIRKLKIPIVPCRSKSGGLHLFIF